MPRVFEFEGVDYELPDDASLADFEEFLKQKDTTARSAAMGGPFPAPQEQELLDWTTMQEAIKRRSYEDRGRPSFLPPLAPIEDKTEERTRISSPGGEPELPYMEAREGSIPFVRPTRIEEVQRGPGTERIIKGEQLPFPYRLGAYEEQTPTAGQELVESFARQPVMTREAATQLAAGADPEKVRKDVGTLDGAVVETPFQAAMRSLPSSVSALMTEAYKNYGPEGDEPLLITGAGVAQEGLAAAGRAIKPYSAQAADYFEKASKVPPRVERAIWGAALSGVKGGVGVLEKVAGVEEGTSPVAQELATLGSLQPVFPRPSQIEDKPISQRVREGEFLADVIKADPEIVKVYDRNFGVLSPITQEAAGILLEARLPLTPVGLVTKAADWAGAAAKGVGLVNKGTTAGSLAAGALSKIAVKQAEKQIAAKLWTDLLGTESVIPVPSGLTLENLGEKIRGAGRSGGLWETVVERNLATAPLLSADEGLRAFDDILEQAVAQGRKDLARVAPRTDLVRVSPKYAVPATIAKKVTSDSADDVAKLRSQARNQGRALTKAEEAAARDAAVIRAAGSEAKRLDELGQFQVLLDGLDTPRAWDTAFFRAAKAVASPGSAMKRAAVAAAEQEVARQGMNALRALRKEVEAGKAAGMSLDDILLKTGQRTLGDVDPREVTMKVLEEAYGPQQAKALLDRALAKFDGFAALMPREMAAFHWQLVKEGSLPLASFPPNFAANTLKIIMEEGVRKTVSKNALKNFQEAYPDLARPVLAVPGKGAATIEEVKFFENGAEDLFKLADSIPTRAAGASLDVQVAAERLAAGWRNLRQKVRVPLVAEAQLLAGERFMAPVRAFLTTRYGIPAGSLGDEVVATPWGKLTPDDLTRMIDDLGGFGPSRLDAARRGLVAQDILLSAAKGWKGNTKDLAMGRPLAYATADAIEEGYRKAAFIKGLQQGLTPEAAMTLARRSQLDYGAADSAITMALAPYWAGAVAHAAAGAEFIDQFAKNPENYRLYVRALREQQHRADKDSLQGDTPYMQFYAPIPDSVTRDVFGRELSVLGPTAPLTQPLTWPLKALKGLDTLERAGKATWDEGLVTAALGGSGEALNELSTKAMEVSAGFGGEGVSSEAKKKSRGAGPASVDQTYMAALALARAADPDGSNGKLAAMLRILDPDVVAPPKALRAYGWEGATAWSEPPPKTPGVWVFEQEEPIVGGDQTVKVYYVIKPSKVGRQRITALQALPFSDLVEGPVRAAGTAEAVGLGEGVLWAVGAETVEEPTRRAVDQTRP